VAVFTLAVSQPFQEFLVARAEGIALLGQLSASGLFLVGSVYAVSGALALFRDSRDRRRKAHEAATNKSANAAIWDSMGGFYEFQDPRQPSAPKIRYQIIAREAFNRFEPKLGYAICGKNEEHGALTHLEQTSIIGGNGYQCRYCNGEMYSEFITSTVDSEALQVFKQRVSLLNKELSAGSP
jgi:hypothetical protein